ncbi:MAG: hypothetical protein RL095_2159 [Verrucomicrobiota bacterium]|jgi:DNA (cytosine-5)-methyltransferase 1
MILADNFAGGGGVSCGMQMALGRGPDYAVNHDAEAIAMHEANHPDTKHLREDVFAVDHREHCDGKPVALMWFSPDCKHFSKAKGGKPVSKKIRGLAWSAVRAAEQVRPAVICLENVEEFLTWGPLGDDGRPCKLRAGDTFRRFCSRLKRLGYVMEWKVLCAADYGAPTIRRRFFLIARCDGLPIVWPEPTHRDPRKLDDLFLGHLKPWRSAAECIDWSIPCPSIFERKRPLVDATCRRVAAGIMRYVVNNPEPFIIAIDNQSSVGAQWPSSLPLTTITCEARHALVCAFLAKHYTGVVGSDLAQPLGTVTTVDHHSLVAAHLTKFYGTSTGADVREPMPTVTASGQHIAEVRAFLVKYYGTGVAADLNEPLDTVTTKDRFGLVTVHGVDYQIVDIGLRMLTPRELARAQGFPDDYVLTGTATSQVARIGNSVPPPVAAAIIGANCPAQVREVAG